MPPFYKKKKFWIPTIIVLLIAGGVFASMRKSKPPEFSTATVERIDLVQSVEETGSVTVANDIKYGFEVVGKVVRVNKKVGDLVVTGELIAALDGTSELQSLRQAQAGLASASAALDLKLEGPSPEEIQKSLAAIERAKANVAQAEADRDRVRIQADAAVETAKTALQTAANNLNIVKETGTSQIIADAYADTLNTMKSALTTLRDGLTNADNILGIDNRLANDDFENVLGASDQHLLFRSEQLYPIAKQNMATAELAVAKITSPSQQTDIDAAAFLVGGALDDMQELLRDVIGLLDATPPIGGVTQTELDALKTAVVTAQKTVDTAVSNLTTASQSIDTAKNSLSSYQITYDQAVRDLENAERERDSNNRFAESSVAIEEAALREAEAAHATLTATPRPVDLGTLRADVSKQQAAVAAAQKQYDKTRLLALATGTLSFLDIRIGENVTANQTIVTIISGDKQIEVDISESDIAKITANDPVEMTLDAFGDEVRFTGKVLTIDPAETEISGVIYYKTTVVLDATPEYDVRPGMTANVQIITDTRPDVLAIPQRAIVERDDAKTVRVITDQKNSIFEERTVETGIRGDNGLIEITAGLKEGEEIITFIKETDL